MTYAYLRSGAFASCVERGQIARTVHPSAVKDRSSKSCRSLKNMACNLTGDLQDNANMRALGRRSESHFCGSTAIGWV
jgi:hypothetical protein